MTPTDLSPSTRSFDPKLALPYDIGHSLPYLQQSSLLFEQNSPARIQEGLYSHSPTYRSAQSTVQAPSFTFFEPFSDVPAPAPVYHPHPPHPSHHVHSSAAPISRAIYSSSSPPAPIRRIDSNRSLPAVDWRAGQSLLQQPTMPSTDWLLPEDKFKYNFGVVGHQEPLRGSFVYQQPHILSQGPVHSHEVRLIHLIPS